MGLLESQSPPNYERTILTNAQNAAATLQNPFPTLPLSSQFPILPVLYGINSTNPALALNSVDPTLRTPYVNQWAFNLQYQAAKDTLVEVGYVGTKGVALPVEQEINQSLLASPSAPINGIITNTSANAPQRVPYPGFSATGLLELETASDSSYNSLQASVTQRFHHGLRFLASYTWSKSLDDISGGATTIFATCEQAIRTTSRPAKGVLRLRPHTTHCGQRGLYEIPRWGGLLNATPPSGRDCFGGWEVSGVGLAQSGSVFSITDTTGAAYYGVTTSTASWAPGATVSTADLSGSVEGRLNKYFNTADFVKAGNLFGNAGRSDSCEVPGAA